jgi:hypothetical protein
VARFLYTDIVVAAVVVIVVVVVMFVVIVVVVVVVVVIVVYTLSTILTLYFVIQMDWTLHAGRDSFGILSFYNCILQD